MIAKLVQTALRGMIEANRAICRIPIARNVMKGAMKSGEVVIPFEPHIPANSDGVCVYINVPFCRSKCTYCYLNTSIYTEERAKPYVEAVKREISLYKAKLGDIELGDVYFRGGTPSILWEGVIDILDHLRSNFKIAGEIGVKVYPGDVNEEMCDALLDAGVSRVNIGVQSFDDDLLKSMNKRYDGDTAIKAIELLVDKGFYTTTKLLIGCPGQTVSSVSSDLKKVIETDLQQIYTLPLLILPNTAWGVQLAKGKIEFPPAREVVEMWRTTFDLLLSNGYETRAALYFKNKKALGEREYLTGHGHPFVIGMGVETESTVPPTLTGYANTFSFEEYIKAVNEGRFPVMMGASILNQRQLDKIYHLAGLLLGIDGKDVERRLNVLMDPNLYTDLRIDKEEFEERTGAKTEEVLGNLSFLIPFLLFPLKALRIIEEDSEKIKINTDVINRIVA